METLAFVRQQLNSGALDARLAEIYGKENIKTETARYLHLADLFETEFGTDGDFGFYSAPGRTEVCGNHTDHNHGKVLAAAINLDAVALATKTQSHFINIKSENYPLDKVDINDLSPKAEETDKSVALVRGVAARFVELGYKVGGFDAVTVNRVLSGSGMSSSACFEVLVGTLLNHLYNDGRVDPVVIAQIAQYAENKYYGKPCGLMDQTACSVGGFVGIDFENPASPIITPVNFDFASCGHKLCIVDTRAGHMDLTDEYAAIRTEMEAVAGYFGKTCLREISREDVMNNLGGIREKTGERPLMRALHFFNENDRVERELKALSEGDFETFKKITVESGYSSYMYNQNVYSSKKPLSQPVSAALAVSAEILAGKGAWRVHGGGFAGTIQAFVPSDLLDRYIAAVEALFGEGACYVLNIRPFGGTEIYR